MVSLAEKYNKLGSGYSIVISRSPIDVLRMSDFKHIQSCHSEGGSYFECAINEAEGGGAIAYLVKTQDLEKIDLKSDEIFKDPERKIPGIEPLSRVRLRNFYNESEEYSLAIPESRVYGSQQEGFLDAVLNWSRNEQIQKDEHGEIEYPDLDDFELLGGSYSDTSSGQLFNSFFNVDFYKGGDDLGEQFLEEAEQIQQEYQNKVSHVYFYYNEDTGDDENPYLSFSGGITIEIPELSREPNWKEYNQLGKKLRDSSELGYINSIDLDYHAGTDLLRMNIDVEGDSQGHPDDYRYFIEHLIENGEKKYNEIVSVVYHWLAENRFLEEKHLSGLNVISRLEDLEYFEEEENGRYETQMLTIKFHKEVELTTGIKNAFSQEMKKQIERLANPSSLNQLKIPGFDFKQGNQMSAKDISIETYGYGAKKQFLWDVVYTLKPPYSLESINLLLYLDKNIEKIIDLSYDVMRKVLSSNQS